MCSTASQDTLKYRTKSRSLQKKLRRMTREHSMMKASYSTNNNYELHSSELGSKSVKNSNYSKSMQREIS